jgi:hypothetical protein
MDELHTMGTMDGRHTMGTIDGRHTMGGPTVATANSSYIARRVGREP